jgi:tetratricopeptide (TPR) repeat protein
MRIISVVVSVSLALWIGAFECAAQPVLHLPEPSPAASVSQTVGLTEIKISYHRPAVAGRKVFGELVPYGEVWRAGANENTTITFSSPVKIGGKTLAAGTYGLQLIPTAKEWTVIFSNMSVAWGSYGYDSKEDALRTVATPQPSEGFEERLSYHFDNPSETAVTATLRWEKLKLPIPIEVDAATTMARMRDELRGVAQFGWVAFAQAAQYWLTHGGNLDEAQRMADRSIAMRETYQNLSTRAAIAEKKGDPRMATELRQKALGIATEVDLNQQGYKLLGERKYDDAIALFRKVATDHPGSWNAHDSLAEAYMSKGDKKSAEGSYAKALSLVKDDANRKRLEGTLARLRNK